MDLSKMIGRRPLLAGLCGLALVVTAAPPAQAETKAPSVRPSWELKPTGSDARLRGLAAVSRKVAWASGSAGTVLRTTDGGRSWRRTGPPGTADLQFRDIEAFDADHAVILAIGENDASRVYRTADGGRTWALAFRNTDPAAFYDCMTFFDRRHGLAMSDPVDGKFRILATADGGRNWRVLPTKGMPAALPAEIGFAASGQCLVAHGRGDVWLATGGGARSRVFHSRDRGRHWTVATTPLPSSPSQGVFAVAFRDARHGIAVGGDYRPGEPSPDAAATTSDGGRTWKLAARPPIEYRSGASWPWYAGPAALAVGPTGSDYSLSSGRTWTRFDTGSFDTVDCAADGACWASGEQGRVARLRPAIPR